MSQSTVVYGMEGIVESSYAASPTFAPANDGILLMEHAKMFPQHARSASRSQSPGGSGILKSAGATSRFFNMTTEHEMRGIGVAYSATDYPRDFHVGLLASGHAAVNVATPGSETWTYTPAALESARNSAALRMFSQGKQYDGTGVYANFKFSIADGQYMVITFDWQGLMPAAPAAASPFVPSALVYDSLLPPSAVNLQLVIAAAFSPVVRSVEFDKQQEISTRLNANATGGHAGFKLGRHAPQLVLTIEQELLSTFNPYADIDAGTLRQILFEVGGTQYNKLDFDAPQAQLISCEEDEDETSALWKLTYACVPSTEVLNDGYNLITN